MGFKTTNTSTREHRVNIDLSCGYEIKHARAVSNTFASFTLALPGLSLYNMRYVIGKDNRRFIAPPEQKAPNGNYYKLYAVYLSDSDTEQIMAELNKILE